MSLTNKRATHRLWMFDCYRMLFPLIRLEPGYDMHSGERSPQPLFSVKICPDGYSLKLTLGRTTTSARLGFHGYSDIWPECRCPEPAHAVQEAS